LVPGLTVIDLTTDIDAPIERVFDLARDLDLHARSMAHTGEHAVGGRTIGRVGVGDTVTWRARHFGVWCTRMRDHWEHRSPLGPLGRLWTPSCWVDTCDRSW
jgi:uncharacterized protein YndB with AHSA1/START domain